jgi:catechol 2,3-dioxygenase-like lactoylglutathione lyase family enzyme
MSSMTGPIVNRLDLVFYWVSDLDRAVAFYEAALGLRLLRRDADNWAEFDAGGRRFALHSVAEGQPLAPGGATAVFSVDDLDRAKADLTARGVEFGHEGDVGGYARFASFTDPDGNAVQLIEYSSSRPAIANDPA